MSDRDPLSLTADQIRGLLERLREVLDERGVQAQLHIVGGAAVALLYPDDPRVRVTADIDATFGGNKAVRDAAGQVAAELGLPPTWLSDRVAPFVPWQRRFEAIPVMKGVTVGNPRELIAMKLSRSSHNDIVDIGIIASREGITDPEELVKIAFEAYGPDSVVLSDDRDEYRAGAQDALDAFDE